MAHQSRDAKGCVQHHPPWLDHGKGISRSQDVITSSPSGPKGRNPFWGSPAVNHAPYIKMQTLEVPHLIIMQTTMSSIIII